MAGNFCISLTRSLDDPDRATVAFVIGKKILVLRFQTSYCKPCARESAALSRVAERFRARGVEVVAIHVQDAPADVRKFIRANRATASRARPTR